MLLLVLALLWVAILIPVAVRYFRDSGTERSIESFHAERDMLSHQEHVQGSEDRNERPLPQPAFERERTGRPHLTIVHPDDTPTTLQARGSWDDWSRDYDYEVAGQSPEVNRYAAAYATVSGEDYNSPYSEQVSMRVRRHRIFVSLLVVCLALTGLTYVFGSSSLEDVTLVAWVALFGFIELALVSLGLGYMGATSVNVEPAYSETYESVASPYGFEDEEFDEDDFEAHSERQWRRETAPRRAFG
jgi:hypothetical protein